MKRGDIYRGGDEGGREGGDGEEGGGRQTTTSNIPRQDSTMMPLLIKISNTESI